MGIRLAQSNTANSRFRKWHDLRKSAADSTSDKDGRTALNAFRILDAELAHIVKDQAHCIVTTNTQAAWLDSTAELLIMDETSQTTLSEAVGVMTGNRRARVLASIGDTKQLRSQLRSHRANEF